MNRSIHIEYPSSLPDALQKTPAEFEHEARLAMAVKLFEMKRLSSGQAALLAGTDRTRFLMQLSEQGVAMIVLPPEELADDVRNVGQKWPFSIQAKQQGAAITPRAAIAGMREHGIE